MEGKTTPRPGQPRTAQVLCKRGKRRRGETPGLWLSVVEAEGSNALRFQSSVHEGIVWT